MSLSGPVPSPAACKPIGRRSLVALCSNARVRTRQTPAKHHRQQSAAGACLAMSDGAPLHSSPVGGTRRRAAAAKAVVNPGTVPGGDLPEVEEDAVEALTDPHAGHAILHDFCMVIPYGLILTVAGIVALLFKGFSTGGALLGAGVLSEVLATLSLKSWKRHKGSQLFTVGSAGIALALAFSMWQRSAAGLAAVAAKALSLISGAMLLFLVYNIAAGGNPPKKDGAEEDPLAPVEEMVTVPLSPQN